MSKNVVICCDGTANEFAANNTNVVKLYSMLDQDPAKQVTFYHPGLGTMEPAGALTTITRKVTKLLGMALGYGLRNDIRDAYVFLMQSYMPGDKIFLFGFSRGAYTVRAVASLLHMYGLIRQGNEPLVPYAIRMLMAIQRSDERSSRNEEAIERYFDLARDFKTNMTSSCAPWFVGVWDTVSSIGWIENPLKLPSIANNPDIEIGRHAVAIDERRAFFRNHLWRKPDDPKKSYGPRDSKQVWFPGVHCDVGGGYSEAESGLSKVALEWMLAEAKLAGLLVDSAKEAAVMGKTDKMHVKPNPHADLHESLTGAWNLAEFVLKKTYDWKTGKYVRRMNLYHRRTIPPGSLVHDSAYQRSANYCSRLPPDAIRVSTPLFSSLEPMR
jgi:uncharacterized protein (DUF2235 family)